MHPYLYDGLWRNVITSSKKKKKGKKEATDNSVIRARNFSFDRRRNKNKGRRGRDAWNRKADTGAFFFFFLQPSNEHFSEFDPCIPWNDSMGLYVPILWIKLPIRDTNWTVNWNTLVSKRSEILFFHSTLKFLKISFFFPTSFSIRLDRWSLIVFFKSGMHFVAMISFWKWKKKCKNVFKSLEDIPLI